MVFFVHAMCDVVIMGVSTEDNANADTHHCDVVGALPTNILKIRKSWIQKSNGDAPSSRRCKAEFRIPFEMMFIRVRVDHVWFREVLARQHTVLSLRHSISEYKISYNDNVKLRKIPSRCFPTINKTPSDTN